MKRKIFYFLDADSLEVDQYPVIALVFWFMGMKSVNMDLEQNPVLFYQGQHTAFLHAA